VVDTVLLPGRYPGRADGQSSHAGAAVTTWAECLLKPVNLLDCTPMYPPPAPQKKK
jgi:hypothetical protein